MSSHKRKKKKNELLIFCHTAPDAEDGVFSLNERAKEIEKERDGMIKTKHAQLIEVPSISNFAPFSTFCPPSMLLPQPFHI